DQLRLLERPEGLGRRRREERARDSWLVRPLEGLEGARERLQPERHLASATGLPAAELLAFAPVDSTANLDASDRLASDRRRVGQSRNGGSRRCRAGELQQVAGLERPPHGGPRPFGGSVPRGRRNGAPRSTPADRA